MQRNKYNVLTLVDNLWWIGLIQKAIKIHLEVCAKTMQNALHVNKTVLDLNIKQISFFTCFWSSLYTWLGTRGVSGY